MVSSPSGRSARVSPEPAKAESSIAVSPRREVQVAQGGAAFERIGANRGEPLGQG